MRISDWSSDVCSSDLPESLATSGAPLRMASPLPAASAHLGRKVLMVGNLFGRELGDEFYMILPKLLQGFIRPGCNVPVFTDRAVARVSTPLLSSAAGDGKSTRLNSRP